MTDRLIYDIKLSKDIIIVWTSRSLITYNQDLEIINEIEVNGNDYFNSLNITIDGRYAAIGLDKSSNIEIFEIESLK